MSGKFLGPDGPTFDRLSADGSRRQFPGGVRNMFLADSGLTMTEREHNGARIIMYDADGGALVLPNRPVVGFTVQILIWITMTTSVTITTADADDLYIGSLEHCNTSSSNATVRYSADLSNDRIITLNGSTTGGLVGSWVDLTYLAPRSAGFGRWLVNGLAIAAGAATPFS
jgi:hypothetical protein